MKNYILILLAFLITNDINAQDNYKTLDFDDVNIIENITVDNIEGGKMMTMKGIDIPLKKIDPFLAFSMSWVSNTYDVEVRFIGKETTEWQTIKEDTHLKNEEGKTVSELIFAPKDSREMELRLIAKGKKYWVSEGIQLHFYNPGKTKKTSLTTPSPNKSTCPCPQPSFQNRAAWCPNGNCPPNSSPSTTVVSHLIVHHSAGTNISNDWAAIVRSIWSLHVNTNGWSDIGYNWLVDPNGVVYEGRGDNILGAHFCGTNGQTAGICMMGDFTNITPQPAAVNKLVELLAWKACDISANPLSSSMHSSSGLNLNHISGHRDGCATQCPGNSFYPMFGQIRTSVDSMINNVCVGTSFQAPTNLVANALSSSSVELYWEDNSSSENGFLIERSPAAGAVNYQMVGSVSADSTHFVDTGLMLFTGYYYRVRAVNATDTSDYTNQVWVATLNTSTTTFLKENKISIYPNPTSTSLNLDIVGDYQGRVEVTILNTIGQQVLNPTMFDKKDNTQQVIDVKKLTSGIYILKLRFEEEIISMQFLKE